jgi:tetratricopeptide (TPR) repeat protein
MIDLFNVAGRTHFTIGEFSAAERDLEQAIALIDRHVDRAHHTYGKALHTLAALRHAQGRVDEAGSHYRQAIDLQLRIRLPTHPGLARLFDDYAVWLADAGREDEAYAYRTRAQAIRAAHRL